MQIDKYILNKKNISILMLCSAAFFWGSTFLFSKFLIDSLSVYEIIFGRSIIAAFILYIIFYKKINKEFSEALKNVSLWFFNASAIIALVLQTESLKYTTASNSAFITALFIVFIPFIKFFIFKEKIDRGFWTVVCFAVVGLYLISFGTQLPTALNIGDVLSLLCALFYAFYIILLEKLAVKFSEGTLTFLYFGIQTLAMLCVIVLQGNFSGMFSINMEQLIDIMALATVGSALPYLLMAKGQQNVSAQVASIIYNLEPVSATILAFLFLGEVIAFSKLIGCFIIFTALLIGTKTD